MLRQSLRLAKAAFGLDCVAGADARVAAAVAIADVVILTTVGDWGNQWAPGETSVPLLFVCSTAFLGGIFSYYSITLTLIS